MGAVNDIAADAAMVTPGLDPVLVMVGPPYSLERTSPLGACSTHAIRLGGNAITCPNAYSSSGVSNAVTMRKQFIAGEVFAFDFAAVLQNPPGHTNNQPFLNIKIFDQNNTVLQERC